MNVSLPLWRQRQRLNFTKIEPLADFLQLTDAQRGEIACAPSFPLNIPYRLAAKMAKGTLDDPLARQFIPVKAEQQQVPGFILDPVGDCMSKRSARLLHKYSGRALLLCTSACAMHCRYCFRQHYDYATTDQKLTSELEAIRADTSLKEIILSGGDPLSLSDQALELLCLQIDAIGHVKRLRIHTRFPIGIPERIDETFIALLKKISKQVWIVLHINHPIELGDDLFDRLKAIQQCGVPILNQAVLLKGVNDAPGILIELCETLVDNGIAPYYLHQLDRVQGAAHFEVDQQVGKDLIDILASKLPGYAVPRYVQELPGNSSKTAIS